MDLDADAIERIGATIASLQESGRADASLRLYHSRAGEFVRVLDDDTAPLTAGMLRAIELFAQSDTRRVWVDREDEGEKENEPMEEEKEEEEEDAARMSAQDCEVVGELSTEEAGIPIKAAEVNHQANGAQKEEVVEEETLSGLANAGVSVSSWLRGEDDATSVEANDQLFLADAAASPMATPSSELRTEAVPYVPIATLMGQWPHAILERTRLCHAPSEAPVSPRYVVYWIRNTLRVSQGNFALAAALELAKYFKLPVVAVSLLPSSIMYPVRHASGINDAVTRWSIEEVRRRLRDDLHIELLAFTPQVSWKPTKPANTTSADGGSALFTLFDALAPVAVVTDDGFSSSARAEVDCLRQFLHMRVRASWALLAVDSMTCVPFQSQSEAVRKSIDVDTAPFLTNDQFFVEYASLLQHRIQFSLVPDPSICKNFQDPLSVDVQNAITSAAKKAGLEEVLWEVIEAINAESANNISSASEHVALTRLESLVAVIDDRPAIQQELQGSGILSLIPLIRHGSLFSGYVLDRLASMISLTPKPSDAKSRKAFATLKVLRSRTSSHLAKDRDYCLYLSLWAAKQLERTQHVTGRLSPFRSILSFKTNLSEMETYKHILPEWISPNKSLGGLNQHTPEYDPYQLESGRTDDSYWNEIQVSLLENRYLHPLLMLYWAYRIMQWSISSRAGVAMIEDLLDKCSLGSTVSADSIFSVWIALFHLGKGSKQLDDSDQQWIQRVEAELSNQQRLQIRK